MSELVDQAVLSRVIRAEAGLDPGRLVFIFENGDHPEERVTAGDLAVHSNQLAAELHRLGIRRGDRVGIMLRNHPEFVYGYSATAQLGAPAVPIDPRSRGGKLDYFISFSECAALLTADYVMADEAAAETIAKTGVTTYVLSTPEGRAAGITPDPGWRSLNEVLDGPEAPDAGEHAELSSPFLLGFTSGTTGDPKAIEFGHDRMLMYRKIPDWFTLREDDVAYTGLSLTHGNALVVTMVPPIWRSIRQSVFSRWFTKTRLWDICRKYGCTTWSNLGGIATAVYSEPPSPRDRDHQVRLVLSAGMPAEIWPAFEERFGVKVLEWYGTMEGGIAWNPVGAGPVGSFGRPPEGLLEMQVVSDDGQPVPDGEMGELLIRPVGGEARLTYFKNPEASARKVQDGWLHTGDVVRRDAGGWYYFAHRREEGGLRKMGEFISEGFIRRALAEDPEVIDVHVYGVPARSGAPGETEIVAAVVPRDRATLDVTALFARAARQLERSQVPDFIQVVDDLPRTPSQKVQARFLLEAFDPAADNVHTATR